MLDIKVEFSKIRPANFRCGDVIEGLDGQQYFISDVDEDAEIATLTPIDGEAWVKAEFLDGEVAA